MSREPDPDARPGALAIAVAVVLLGVAIWETVATVRATTSVPDDAAWVEAARLVRQDHRDGDLIVFSPAWIDPVGRLHLGDLISTDQAARMDTARYGRIWELAIRGARDPELAGLAPVFEREVAGIVIRRYERRPAVIAADVRELLPQAKLEAAPAALVLAEVGFAPHRCIQVTAQRAPAKLTFTLPAGTLVGYAGIADVFTRRDNRAPGTLEVVVGGVVVAAISPGVDDGWVRFSAEVPAGDVTFVVRSAAPGRLVCFAAEVRR